MLFQIRRTERGAGLHGLHIDRARRKDDNAGMISLVCKDNFCSKLTPAVEVHHSLICLSGCDEGLEGRSLEAQRQQERQGQEQGKEEGQGLGV